MKRDEYIYSEIEGQLCVVKKQITPRVCVALARVGIPLQARSMQLKWFRAIGTGFLDPTRTVEAMLAEATAARPP